MGTDREAQREMVWEQTERHRESGYKQAQREMEWDRQRGTESD